MKKIIISLSSIIFILGCSLNKPIVNLNNIEEKIDHIQLDELDLNEIVHSIEKEDFYDKMEYKKDEELKLIGLDVNEINDYIYRKSTTDSDKYGFYIILKVNDTYKEKAKEIMNNYFTNLINEELDSDKLYLLLNKIEFEYNDYLIYIVGNKNNTILDKIIENKKKVFTNLIKINEVKLKDLNIGNGENLEKYLMKISSNINNSDLYFIVKPKKGKKLEVEESINKYFNKLEEKFKNNETELNKIKNKTITNTNDYLIYIISSDNEKVLKTIKNELK